MFAELLEGIGGLADSYSAEPMARLLISGIGVMSGAGTES